MKHRLLVLFSAVSLLSSIGCTQPQAGANSSLPAKAPGRYVESLTSAGIPRSYILRVPRGYDGKKRLPLVVLLHGWTGSAKTSEMSTRMGIKAQQEDFVLAIPDGLGNPQGWNAGFIDLSGKKQDDVAFIDKLIEQVESEVGIDPDRVYVAGHSNGAMMTNLIGAKLSHKVAAIAAVAGSIGVPKKEGGFNSIPEPVGPVSVLLIHGKQDKMVQYESTAQALLHVIGAMDSAKWWAKNNGCKLEPKETTSTNANIITTTFERGKDRTEVSLISILNGTHDWPGGIGLNGVEMATGLNATDVIWDFFKSHPKKH